MLLLIWQLAQATQLTAFKQARTLVASSPYLVNNQNRVGPSLASSAFMAAARPCASRLPSTAGCHLQKMMLPSIQLRLIAWLFPFP
jgi:hypothetical protein